MIFVIDFSCLSRGPDDQGLSLRPGHHHRQGKARRPAAGAVDQEKERTQIGGAAWGAAGGTECGFCGPD
jgi:hypothetical protein